MVQVAVWVTLSCLCIPLYAYVGYPVLLFVLASLVQVGRDAYYLLTKAERRRRSANLPFASIIISAHNEEAVIERTLKNCLALDYPPDRLEVLLGSDGSTDRTRMPALRLVCARKASPASVDGGPPATACRAASASVDERRPSRVTA